MPSSLAISQFRHFHEQFHPKSRHVNLASLLARLSLLSPDYRSTTDRGNREMAKLRTGETVVAYTLNVNGQQRRVEVEADTPLTPAAVHGL